MDVPFGYSALAPKVGFGGSTQVFLSTGAVVTPDQDGVIVVPQSEVQPLVNLGWIKITRQIALPPAPALPASIGVYAAAAGSATLVLDPDTGDVFAVQPGP